jgi:hypothetical protein
MYGESRRISEKMSLAVDAIARGGVLFLRT